MTRGIQVSTDVFQAIWQARRSDENSEDAVLRRLLKVKGGAPASTVSLRDLHVQIGFTDPRYGVSIPHDFEIFRTYKGREYRARAIQGFWNWNGTGYPTLNELNTAIGIAHENAWKAWFYNDEKGRRRPLSEKRDQSKIIRRTRIEDLA